MAELKISELREKDKDALVNLEKELTENLFAARLQKRTGQLENTAKIALTKRDLARVKTVLRARELGLEVIETAAPGAEKKAKAPKPAAKPAAKKEEKKKAAKPEAKKAAAKSEKKSEKKAESKKSDKKAGKSAGKKK
jgi:large subunit ribosomal protein L29